MTRRYYFDSSAFLEAHQRHYPMDVFPTVWRKLEDLVEHGRIVAPEPVLDELKKKDDDLARWAKNRKAMFLPLSEEVQASASEVLAVFPRLVDTVKGRGKADPFVIALARVEKITLVSHEKFVTGTQERPRIPNACKHFDVKHLNVVAFMREQGWRF